MLLFPINSNIKCIFLFRVSQIIHNTYTKLIQSILSNVWPFPPRLLASGSFSSIRKNVLSSHTSHSDQHPTRGKLRLESQKVAKKSKGQQNFQAISFTAISSYTIIAFSVTHQSVISMHSKITNFTVWCSRSMKGFGAYSRQLSLSCNWLNLWKSEAFAIPTHAHTHIHTHTRTQPVSRQL